MNLARLVAASALVLPLIAAAQEYPSKVIRIVVPYAPGGAVDVATRPIAQKLAEILGQPVIVDNRPGGSATIGAENVAKSPPDGYSLLMTSINHYTVPMFLKAAPYDAARDFTPIAPVVVTPNVLAVHPSVPASTVAELISYGKKNPGKLFYGTTGIGSTHHLAGLLLQSTTGMSFDHVPYRGGSPTINDALGGQIPVAILTAATIMPYAKSGRLRALAVIEAKRAPAMPELPAIGETVPGYAIPETWFGLLGPAKLPAPIVKKLNSAVHQVMAMPEIRKAMEQSDFQVSAPMSEKEFATKIDADVAVFRRITSAAGIKPE